MRLTFVHAPSPQPDQGFGAAFLPLWAYTLAAHVPPPWTCSLLDLRFDDLGLAAEAEVFAFSGLSQDLDVLDAAARTLRTRYPRARLLIGGPITWSLSTEGRLDRLRAFDHCFILDGEATLPAYLCAFAAGTVDRWPRVTTADRFDVSASRAIDLRAFGGAARRYFGAVVEVSRGCPHLCEFCDVRVLPDNNRTHHRPVDVVVKEIEDAAAAGVRFIQLACDNFYGMRGRTEELLDAMIARPSHASAPLSFYTWVTLNVSRDRPILEKMRRAGIDILFVGVETANPDSLRETAKMQNLLDARQALRTLAELGFVVIPGLIFGFDSDDGETFARTRALLEDGALVAGDPQFLTALPGTPLHQRLRATARLVAEDYVVRRKVATNIRYLQPVRFWVSGYRALVSELSTTRSQARRFFSFARLAARSPSIRGSERRPGSMLPLLRVVLSALRRPALRAPLLRRAAFFLRPDRLAVAAGALFVSLRAQPPLVTAWSVWLLAWSTLGAFRARLTDDDFGLHAVGGDFPLRALFPEEMLAAAAAEPVRDGVRVAAQARQTSAALARLAERRGSLPEPHP